MIGESMLRRLNEPGAVLALTNNPVTAWVVRDVSGGWRQTWRGSKSQAREACRTGLVEMDQHGKQVAIYRMSPEGRARLRDMKSRIATLEGVVERLKSDIDDLRAEVAELRGAGGAQISAAGIYTRIEGLTKGHSGLVNTLKKYAGRVLSKADIAQAMNIKISCVDVYISQLRNRHTELGAHIETVWGEGYRWKP